MSNTNFGNILQLKIECGSGILWIYLPGGDEGYCERTIAQTVEGDAEASPPIIPKLPDSKIYYWDAVHGATWSEQFDPSTGELAPASKKLCDPLKALQAIANGDGLNKNCVTVMRDLHKFINNEAHYGLRRCIAELAKANQLNNTMHVRPIIILADTPTPHSDIKDYCDVLDFSLPDYDEMERDVFAWIQRSLRETNPDTDVADCDDELKDKIIRGLLGTSSEEAQRIMSYATTVSKGLNASVLDIIAKEKANVIRKMEGLTYIPNEKIPLASHFAGFDSFLSWLTVRARAYTRHAQEVGQELPRGAVLIGPPGTGKTEIAKAAAKVLGLDLIIMDIAALFDKFVGGTEKKIRGAIQMVDAMPQCLLMVDEIDKVFAGSHENQAADSGVSSRMLSTFLSWLSGRDVRSKDANRTFVIVTMNRTAGIPPEFLRTGRFDCVFSTDLPDQEIREKIARIHLEKRGIDTAKYGKGLKTLAGSITDGFVPAEIEEVIRSARANAYSRAMDSYDQACAETEKANEPAPASPTAEDVAPSLDDLLEAAKILVPLSQLCGADLEEIRKFCRERTTPVHGRSQKTKQGRQSRRVQTTAKNVDINTL